MLDFGCGSGRDTKYFLTRGCQVDAIDGSLGLCKPASALKNNGIIYTSFKYGTFFGGEKWTVFHGHDRKDICRFYTKDRRSGNRRAMDHI